MNHPGSAAARLAALLVALVCPGASAQSVAPAPQNQPVGRPMLLGSLQVYPSISLRDVGMDTNIYNATLVVREDFTYTVAPRVLAELPVGDSRFVGTGGLGFVFFRQYKDQQSLNGAASGLFEVRSGRVRPSVSAGFSRSRQRGGDVDVRALSVSTNGRAAVDVGVSGITSFTAWVVRDDTAFAAGEVFLGGSLGDQLDRSTTTFAAGAKLDLTPLTSVVAAAELEQTRFTVARLRDADSVKITPTVRFAEGAIVNGQASLGLRDFRPLNGPMPGYRGFIASGDLRYTLLNVTRFEVRANRDLAYSYDELQPYYLEAGAQLTVSQRLVGPFDAIGLAGRRTWRYRALSRTLVPGLVETIDLWGGGVGVRVDDHMRLTLTLDRERRVSGRSELRQYERNRLFAALEYLP